jgi:hypothetical protein
MRETGSSTNAEYCGVNELAGDDCLNFMVFTLVKAIEAIENRLGAFDASANSWRYGKLVTVRKEHIPFSDTPL